QWLTVSVIWIITRKNGVNHDAYTEHSDTCLRCSAVDRIARHAGVRAINTGSRGTLAGPRAQPYPDRQLRKDQQQLFPRCAAQGWRLRGPRGAWRQDGD